MPILVGDVRLRNASRRIFLKIIRRQIVIVCPANRSKNFQVRRAIISRNTKSSFSSCGALRRIGSLSNEAIAGVRNQRPMIGPATSRECMVV